MSNNIHWMSWFEPVYTSLLDLAAFIILIFGWGLNAKKITTSRYLFVYILLFSDNGGWFKMTVYAIEPWQLFNDFVNNYIVLSKSDDENNLNIPSFDPETSSNSSNNEEVTRINTY